MDSRADWAFARPAERSTAAAPKLEPTTSSRFRYNSRDRHSDRDMKLDRRSIKSRRPSLIRRACLLCASQLMCFALCALAQKQPLNTAPANEASAAIQVNKLRLSNATLDAEWRCNNNKNKNKNKNETGLIATTLTDHLNHRTVPLASSAFAVTLQDGTVLKSSEMKVITSPRLLKLAPDPN